jgi:hypothetical protein
MKAGIEKPAASDFAARKTVEISAESPQSGPRESA